MHLHLHLELPVPAASDRRRPPISSPQNSSTHQPPTNPSLSLLVHHPRHSHFLILSLLLQVLLRSHWLRLRFLRFTFFLVHFLLRVCFTCVFSSEPLSALSHCPPLALCSATGLSLSPLISPPPGPDVLLPHPLHTLRAIRSTLPPTIFCFPIEQSKTHNGCRRHLRSLPSRVAGRITGG